MKRNVARLFRELVCVLTSTILISNGLVVFAAPNSTENIISANQKIPPQSEFSVQTIPTEALDQKLPQRKDLDLRAFFVGAVERSYDESRPYSHSVIDFSEYIDDFGRTIRSVTGETIWDYKNGIARVDTPKSQGATGFLSKLNKIRLSDVIIESRNEYSTILVISLDGKPINESEKILVQSGQDDKLFDYQDETLLDSSGNRSDTKQVVQIGQYPYNVVKTNAVVTFRSIEKFDKVIKLDENGYPKETLTTVTSSNRQAVVKLPEDSLYTVLLRGEAAEQVKFSEGSDITFRDGYDYIWWEGEDYSEATGFSNTSFKPDIEFPETKHLLSGGDWLTNDGDWTDADTDNPATVKYNVEVKDGDTYNFYVRKFWLHGHFRWRFDDQNWSVVDDSVALLDDTFLKRFTNANWVNIGVTALTEGNHTLEIQMMPRDNKKPAGFDCFLLTKTPFTPRGLLRPGEKSAKANAGMWAFEPDMEYFGENNIIDLRYLNEEIAGQNGPVYQKDGKLYLGDGTEQKFWGANIRIEGVTTSSYSAIDYFVRLLAKYGVNYIRVHGRPWDDNFRTKEEDIDKIQYFVSVCKENGIYINLSTYFILWNNLHQNDQFKHVGEVGPDGFVGFLNYIKEGYAYIIWNKELQDAFKDALKNLLTAPNKYGPPLIDEPAIALIEMMNEDSFFFYTFGSWRWPDADKVKFAQLFGSWLVNKYGSVSKTLRAWGNLEPANAAPARNDNHERQAFDIQTSADYSFYSLPGEDWWSRRKKDVYQFLLETQYNFYDNIDSYLKDDLGYKGMTTASNWHTIDDKKYDAAERYTYLPGDVIDHHGYADNVNHITDRGYQINVGDKFIETPVVLSPDRAPVAAVNIRGKATSISEIAWVNPSSHKVDEPFFLSVYGSLQGIDMFNNYQSTSMNWETTYSKWPQNTPSKMAQWAGFALAYRRGDIKEAQVVATENIDNSTLMNLPTSGVRIYNGALIDNLRQ